MPKKILVVDDDEDFITITSASIKKGGYDVDIAYSGEECLKKVRQNKPDLILLDVMMPGVNGVQVLNRISYDMPQVPVIIMTSYSSIDTTVQSFKMGAIDFLSKPVTPDEIIEAINRATTKKILQVPAPATARSDPALYVSDKTPADVAKGLTENIGPAKMQSPLYKTMLLGILAGVYIAIGGAASTLVGADSSNYIGMGLSKVASGLVFSVGLILVIIAGAELFTGNNLIFMSVLDKPNLLKPMLSNWGTVYVANFIGSLLVAIIIYTSGLWKMGDASFGMQALNIANAKVHLNFFEAIVRGIGCNVLVCLAVWMAQASQQVTGKILAIVFPITVFVALGFEHCIANMYFIPLGMFINGSGALSDSVTTISNLTINGFVINNLLPVTFGNIIGGSIFAGTVYWFAYSRTSKEAVAG